MERKVLQLMSDNKALSLALEQTSRRKDSEISELHNSLTKVGLCWPHTSSACWYGGCYALMRERKSLWGKTGLACMCQAKNR